MMKISVKSRGLFFRTLLMGLLTIVSTQLLSQSGQYISDTYFYYIKDDKIDYTDVNPIYTNHRFYIDINISEITGIGEIVIKDIDANTVVNHIINGKVKELYDESTNSLFLLYSATLNAYGLSQLESLLLIYDSKTYDLDAIVTTSFEFNSKGNYVDIRPLDETLSSTGSGFIVSYNGYLITNYHVVKGANEIIVKGINGDCEKAYNATLINFDEVNDIALLKIEGNFNINFNVIKELKEVGEDIFVLGYPLISIMGTEIKLTSGIVNSQSGYLNNKSYYQISAPIQPGNSGCPLFDSNGNIVGLVTSGITYGENVGYALKSSIISDFLLKNGISIPNNKNINFIEGLPQKVKLLKPNIIFIEAIRK